MTKQREIRIGTLIAGVLTALAVIVSQFFYFEKVDHTKKEVKAKTEQHDDQSSDTDNTVYTLPSNTPPPTSTHVEFLQDSFCLFEIIFPEKKVTVPDLGTTLSLGKFFQTLFHTLISPNAP